MASRYKKGVAFSDQHFPYQDKYICNEAIKFVELYRPDIIHLLGDLVDFYPISKFLRDPSRKLSLQDEIDTAVEWLSVLRETAPNTRIIFAEGNHEHRLVKYLRSRSPELENLRSLSLPKLLSLDTLKIEYYPENQPYRVDKMLFTHGSMVYKWSGQTAKAHREKYGCSVLIGHSHRIGAFHHSNTIGDFSAFENGTMADFLMVAADYVNAPDWQHGWSIIEQINKDGDVSVEQIKFVGGQYRWRGHTYGRRKKLNNTTCCIQEIK